MSLAVPTMRASTVWLASTASERTGPVAVVSRCSTTCTCLAPATTCALVMM